MTTTLVILLLLTLAATNVHNNVVVEASFISDGGGGTNSGRHSWHNNNVKINNCHGRIPFTSSSRQDCTYDVLLQAKTDNNNNKNNKKKSHHLLLLLLSARGGKSLEGESGEKEEEEVVPPPPSLPNTDGDDNIKPTRVSSSSSSTIKPSIIKPNLDPLAKYMNDEIKSKKKPAAKRGTWYDTYEILVEYYKEHGDSNVPHSYKKDPKLGTWVASQRKRKKRLSVDKIALLDALGFIWDGEVAKKLWGDKKWEEMFQWLVQYKKENGHCNVSLYDKDNKELGIWVQSQRRSYTNSVPSLTPSRIQKLDSIGFVWRLRAFSEKQSDIWDEQWNEKFEELFMYKKEKGHCNVPKVYEPNQPLGDWVHKQRQMNAGTSPGGAVRLDRKKRLDEIGFDWDFGEIYDEAWLIMYNQLKKAKKRYEENNLERQTWSSASDQLEVWNWEAIQQDQYRRGKLDPQREALLEEIGYWESVGLKRETTKISQ